MREDFQFPYIIYIVRLHLRFICSDEMQVLYARERIEPMAFGCQGRTLPCLSLGRRQAPSVTIFWEKSRCSSRTCLLTSSCSATCSRSAAARDYLGIRLPAELLLMGRNRGRECFRHLCIAVAGDAVDCFARDQTTLLPRHPRRSPESQPERLPGRKALK